jgi:formate dehydrogenase accessory protein FdhE
VKEAPNAPNIVASFERRAARAELLAADHPAAKEPLQFAAGLYRAQAPLAAAFAAHGRLAGELDRDWPPHVRELRALLRFVAASAPPELAGVARARAEEEPAVLASRLHASWTGDNDGRTDYLSRALLQPYLQVLAALRISPARPTRLQGASPGAATAASGAPSRCPFCGGAPWIAARRAASDADGAQRFLVCALCSTEWPLGRLRCPVCTEEDPMKLASFQSDAHPTARVETCETCRCYVKSLDLTLDGRLIPEVDDVVSLAMDLWAADQGFTRVEPGLAGI